MKEFHKKMKYVVTTKQIPQRETIRDSIKYKKAKERRLSFSAFAVATSILAFLVIVLVGPAVIQSLQKPHESSTLPQEVNWNNVYPLTFRIDDWEKGSRDIENPASWEEILDGVRNGRVDSDCSPAILSETPYLNATTKGFYEVSGYQYFRAVEKKDLYLYNRKTLHHVQYEDVTRTANPVALFHTKMEGILFTATTLTDNVYDVVVYYDLQNKIYTPLLSFGTASVSNSESGTCFLTDGKTINVGKVEPLVAGELIYHDDGNLSVRLMSFQNLKHYPTYWQMRGADWIEIGILHYDTFTHIWSYTQGEKDNGEVSSPFDSPQSNTATIYPITFADKSSSSLWENGTSSALLAEKLNREEIVFANPLTNILEEKDKNWKVTDFENVTTEEIYSLHGCEFFLADFGVFVLQENQLYQILRPKPMSNEFANVEDKMYFAKIIPCTLPNRSRGVFVFATYLYTKDPRVSFTAREIGYYDLQSHTFTELFRAIGEENEDTFKYVFRSSDGKGTELGGIYPALQMDTTAEGTPYLCILSPARFEWIQNTEVLEHRVARVKSYTHLGNLSYDAERNTWSYERVVPSPEN